MTIGKAFIDFLQKKSFGVFGQNLYLYRVPSTLQTDNDIVWVIPSGGNIVGRNRTGELIKAYTFIVYYRHTSAERVDTFMAELENTLNCAGCVELENYELLEIETSTLPADQDVDSENRMVGQMTVRVQIYKRCN